MVGWREFPQGLSWTPRVFPNSLVEDVGGAETLDHVVEGLGLVLGVDAVVLVDLLAAVAAVERFLLLNGGRQAQETPCGNTPWGERNWRERKVVLSRVAGTEMSVLRMIQEMPFPAKPFCLGNQSSELSRSAQKKTFEFVARTHALSHLQKIQHRSGRGSTSVLTDMQSSEAKKFGRERG